MKHRHRPAFPEGILGCLLGLLLVGCGERATREDQLEAYLQRFANAINAEIRVPAAPDKLEPLRLTPLPTPEDTIGVLDFLSLSGCDLQVNLGRRNSSLGRAASPSQRLLLDLEFLRLAPACIQSRQSSDPSLAKQLQALFVARQQALPQTLYNALLAGPEWQLFWRSPQALGDYPAATGGDIADQLGQLNQWVERWLAGDYRADGAAFELLLNELRAGDGGLLLLAAQRQREVLAVASSALGEVTAAQPLCPFTSDTSRSKALRNVTRRFFAEGLQPWLADLRRRSALLMPAVEQLEQQLAAALPPDYLDWQRTRDALLSSLSESPRVHALAVSDALLPCGGINPPTP